MPFALKLFQINLYNTYYQAGVCNDFDLVPDMPTQQWMNRYKLKLIAGPGSFEVAWLVAGLENPLAVFQTKMAEKKLTFQLKLKNPQVIHFSDLRVGEALGSIYYLNNLHALPRLHQEAYLSDTDYIGIQKIVKNYHQPGKNIFGIIDIHLNNLWQDQAPNLEALPIQYTIHIQAKASIWRYHIIDTNNRIKMPMQVVLNQDNSYFKERANDQSNPIHLYESKEPLAMLDKPAQFFSLKTNPSKEINSSATTLIALLPTPGFGSALIQDKEKSEILYSDIFVHV